MWARKTRRIYKYILQFLELSRYLQEDVPVEKGSSFGEAFCAGHCLGTVLGHSISTVPSEVQHFVGSDWQCPTRTSCDLERVLPCWCLAQPLPEAV